MNRARLLVILALGLLGLPFCGDDAGVEDYPLVCSDGLDNDNDRKIDCDDSDCADLPLCAASVEQQPCGNGALDPGEGCDTQIPAGQPGACPTSCDDGNACTVDTLDGPGTCNASCSAQPITQCAGGDGCCPAGCTAGSDSDCSPSCGDGVLDPGESCDTQIPAGQPGACPSSCDDGSACTVDALQGAGTCSASCSAQAITQCAGGDGCCPAGCTANSDGDCSPSCGNGALEPGESCDVKIPAGQPGACPSSCDDGNACTVDTLQGTGTCNAGCSTQAITQCAPGDGCCPTGCTANSDGDCSPSCGNGALEPGESCDVKIPAGQKGACPTSCDDGKVCTIDVLIGAGTCNASCGAKTITQCASGDGCCPAGCTANSDGDCQAVCGNGALEPGESCDVKIPAGQKGACPTSCEDGDLCTTDKLANPGTCQAQCLHSPPMTCNDGNPCTTDACNPKTGKCEAVPKVCNDLNPCTSDYCNKLTGKCVYAAKTCNDNNPCTSDSCSLKTGQCLFLPKSCNDGNACTDDACDPKTGSCYSSPTSCDDGNQCTKDTCDSQKGCIHIPICLK